MEPVRYRPGEAIRWLESGAESSRDAAKQKAKKLSESDPEASAFKKVGKGIKTAAGAAMDMGRGAWADLLVQRAGASEFVFLDNQVDVVNGNSIRAIPYTSIRAIKQKGDRTALTLDKGSLTIKPYAYIVAGKLRVPIGWTRNDMEVPFELLVEELSARCGVEVQKDG
jgi:hypothetical protein